jgi:hypothetical protein
MQLEKLFSLLLFQPNVGNKIQQGNAIDRRRMLSFDMTTKSITNFIENLGKKSEKIPNLSLPS